jgi:hypothetical protein
MVSSPYVSIGSQLKSLDALNSKQDVGHEAMKLFMFRLQKGPAEFGISRKPREVPRLRMQIDMVKLNKEPYECLCQPIFQI